MPVSATSSEPTRTGSPGATSSAAAFQSYEHHNNIGEQTARQEHEMPFQRKTPAELRSDVNDLKIHLKQSMQPPKSISATQADRLIRYHLLRECIQESFNQNPKLREDRLIPVNVYEKYEEQIQKVKGIDNKNFPRIPKTAHELLCLLFKQESKRSRDLEKLRQLPLVRFNLKFQPGKSVRDLKINPKDRKMLKALAAYFVAPKAKIAACSICDNGKGIVHECVKLDIPGWRLKNMCCVNCVLIRNK